MFPEKSSEFQLIDRMRDAVGARRDVPVGIGDDAAVVSKLPDSALMAADILLEGVHFEMPPATPREVGHKAMAVNLSDIAAMAGIPRFALVSVALPRRTGDADSFADDLFAGLQNAAERFGVVIVGGDTTTWDGPLVVNVTVTGDVHARGPVVRSGARAGDWIFVSGELGGSLAGRHLKFEPRIQEARILHETVELRSMIDISDGLVADLYHILEESRVGAILRAEDIPVSPALLDADGVAGRPAVQHALGDGEDFELLFTVSPDDGERLLNADLFTTRLTRIGTITKERRCLLTDAVRGGVELPRLGWAHAFE